MPGPLFTFAAYLATVDSPEPRGLAGAVLGLVGIFLPGFSFCWLPCRSGSRSESAPEPQAIMQGVNAAVVGAALYHPVWTTTVHTGKDFSNALVGFV